MRLSASEWVESRDQVEMKSTFAKLERLVLVRNMLTFLHIDLLV